MTYDTTGAVLSPLDHRDYQAAQFAPATAVELLPIWGCTPALDKSESVPWFEQMFPQPFIG